MGEAQSLVGVGVGVGVGYNEVGRAGGAKGGTHSLRMGSS